MRVVHVLRKPLSEGTVAANTLRHGTGGINIDASRVGTHGEVLSCSIADPYHAKDGTQRTWNPTTTRGAERSQHSAGRWPANVILQHPDGCRRTGTRPAEGYQINRFTDGARHFGGAAGHAYEGMAMEGGVETVWVCAPGCPAVVLDEQSGVLRARGNLGVSGGGGGMYGHGETTNDFGFGDVGGASRFFKQVGGCDE